jgi:hypothetical protein
MKMAYEGKISRRKDEDGVQIFSVVANWDEEIKVEANTLAEAQKEFNKLLSERGVDVAVVSFRMVLG